MNSDEKEIVAAVSKELIKPIYEDAFNPSLSTIGKGAGDLLRFVCLPFSFLGLTAEQLEIKYRNFVEKAINKVPDSDRKNIINSNEAKSISSILEQVKYCFDDEKGSLYELFNNLLAACLNSTKQTPHPYYISILNDFTPIDALFLKSLFLMSASPESFSFICMHNNNNSDKWYLFAPQNIYAVRSREENLTTQVRHVDFCSDFHISEKNDFKKNDINDMARYVIKNTCYRDISSDNLSKVNLAQAGFRSLDFLRARGLIDFVGFSDALEYPQNNITAIPQMDIRTVFCLDRIYKSDAFYKYIQSSVKTYSHLSLDEAKEDWEKNSNNYQYRITQLGAELAFQCGLLSYFKYK